MELDFGTAALLAAVSVVILVSTFMASCSNDIPAGSLFCNTILCKVPLLSSTTGGMPCKKRAGCSPVPYVTHR